MSSKSQVLRERTTLLHEELLSGSTVASAQLAELLLVNVSKFLKSTFFNVKDEHIIATSVEDAILTYLRNPDEFDPERGSLLSYIITAAKWRLLSAISRKREKNVELESHENVSIYSGEPDLPIEDVLIAEDEDKRTFKRLRELLPDSRDQAMLEAMMDGERITDTYAAILGISDQPQDVKRQEVKRNKDRIKIVIRRKFDRNQNHG